MTDAEFDALHGGRELLPIEQAIYEAEGAERFARVHGHGRVFPEQAAQWAEINGRPTIDAAVSATGEGGQS